MTDKLNSVLTPSTPGTRTETRLCPTCGDTDLVLTPNEPIEGWSELACKGCGRVFEIGRPGVGPLVDPLWKEIKQ